MKNDEESVIIAVGLACVFILAFSLILIALYFRMRKQTHAAGFSSWNCPKCLHFLRRLRYAIEAIRHATSRWDKQPVDSISGAEDPREDACSEQTYYSIGPDTLPPRVPHHPEGITHNKNIASAALPVSGRSVERIRPFSSLEGDDVVMHLETTPALKIKPTTVEATQKNVAEPRDVFEPISTVFVRETARTRYVENGRWWNWF